MFEKASRLKLRFDTPRGRLTVEDIWDLPLKGGDANLDDLAKTLYQESKTDTEMSFVDDPPEPNESLSLRFEIVKHVIGVRKEEMRVAEQAAANKQKKEQILEIIAEKENESLKRKSVTKLRELVDSL